jgi:hypothetical protein
MPSGKWRLLIMTKEEQDALGFEPVGNKNNQELNDFKETLLYLIKFDKDVQEAIKKFIL